MLHEIGVWDSRRRVVVRAARVQHVTVAWGLRMQAWERVVPVLVRVKVRHETRVDFETDSEQMPAEEVAGMQHEAWLARRPLAASTNYVQSAFRMGLELELVLVLVLVLGLGLGLELELELELGHGWRLGSYGVHAVHGSWVMGLGTDMMTRNEHCESTR